MSRIAHTARLRVNTRVECLVGLSVMSVLQESMRGEAEQSPMLAVDSGAGVDPSLGPVKTLVEG